MLLERKIEIYANNTEEFRGASIKTILSTLFYDREWSLAQLCREFEASRPAMAACLRRNGLELKYANKSKVQYQLEKRGYTSIAEFFKKHWRMTFAQMAAELGVFPRTISREYKKYKDSVREEEAGAAENGDASDASASA